MEGRGAAGNVRFLLLLPTAITVFAFYEKVFGLVHFLARLARHWLEFWNAIWSSVFAWLDIHLLRALPPDAYDPLTLWTTLVGVVGLVPIVLAWSGIQSKEATVQNVVNDLLPAGSRVLRLSASVALITLAVAVVFAPFLTTIRLLGSGFESVVGTALAGVPDNIRGYILGIPIALFPPVYRAVSISAAGMWVSAGGGEVVPQRLPAWVNILLLFIGLACVPLSILLYCATLVSLPIVFLAVAGSVVCLTLFAFARSALPFVQIAALVAFALVLDPLIVLTVSAFQELPEGSLHEGPQ